MSNELIKYAFTAGELSPTLLGRSDLEQYDLGLALANNWIVDYRGGVSTRAGSEFCEFVMRDDLPTKYFEFSFNPDIANVYLILFGHNYVRFVQDGSYVLEASKVITAIAGAVVTSAAHGYAVGDWVKIGSVVGISNINDRTYQISAVTTNTFTLTVVPDLSAFVPTGAYTSGGTVSRVYTVATPYAASDLANLHGFQRRDTLRMTHTSFPIYNLKRLGSTNWTLTQEDIGNNVNAPLGVAVTPSAAGSAGVLVTVTAIFADDTESLMAVPLVVPSIVNYTTTAGNISIGWLPVAGAVSYKIYRSIVIADGTKMHTGYQLGFIGEVKGRGFVDSNIIPDFTKTPPIGDNPFAPGQIDMIEITTGGTGYSQNSTCTMSGGGTGFIGVPVVINGIVTAVRIIARGKNYVSPTISFAGGGTGAAATVTATPLVGQNPSISTIFQQRQLYASTANNPLTLWASHPGLLSNFDFSDITIESDAYEFEVDSAEVSPIKHMIPMRGGLVIMSQSGIWQLSGGDGRVVTPTNALADPQNYSGSSDVMPIKVGTDLLYIEGKGFTVRLLSYNEFAKVYGGEDKSILSNHLFAFGKRITSWTFAENPFKVVYAVRSDGALLSFTIVKDEKVFAWTWNTTFGKYLDCKSVYENAADRLYVMTQRKINGRLTKFIERLAIREFEFSEDSFCVDCGLSLPGTYPSATVQASTASGNVTLTTDVNTFAPGDVGKVVRLGGGKIKLTGYTNAKTVTGYTQRDITDVQFQDVDNTPNPQPAGEWTMDAPVTQISGLWHLEGKTVSVLADGNVVPQAVVTNGAITLENPATRVIVGLPFTAILQTLSPVVTDAIIEGRRKRVVGVATRVSDTRGLMAGRALDSLYEARERVNESYGEPIELWSGIRTQMIDPEWDDNGQSYFVQDKPLPATLLGLVFDIEVGDDPN